MNEWTTEWMHDLLRKDISLRFDLTGKSCKQKAQCLYGLQTRLIWLKTEMSKALQSYTVELIRGGDLAGTGGTVPKKIWGEGTAHASVPLNILRSSVVGCARKYEQSEKGVIKEFFSEIVVVLVRKGSFKTFNIVRYGKSGERKGKSEKPCQWLKKGHEKNFGRDNGNFLRKKRHSEILVLEKFSVPPKLDARPPPLELRPNRA